MLKKIALIIAFLILAILITNCLICLWDITANTYDVLIGYDLYKVGTITGIYQDPLSIGFLILLNICIMFIEGYIIYGFISLIKK